MANPVMPPEVTIRAESNSAKRSLLAQITGPFNVLANLHTRYKSTQSLCTALSR